MLSLLPRFGQRIRLAGKSEAQGYTVHVTSREELELIQNSLGRRAREVWVSHLSPSGPQWVRLPDFLSRT